MTSGDVSAVALQTNATAAIVNALAYVIAPVHITLSLRCGGKTQILYRGAEETAMSPMQPLDLLRRARRFLLWQDQSEIEDVRQLETDIDNLLSDQATIERMENAHKLRDRSAFPICPDDCRASVRWSVPAVRRFAIFLVYYPRFRVKYVSDIKHKPRITEAMNK